APFAVVGVRCAVCATADVAIAPEAAIAHAASIEVILRIIMTNLLLKGDGTGCDRGRRGEIMIILCRCKIAPCDRYGSFQHARTDQVAGDFLRTPTLHVSPTDMRHPSALRALALLAALGILSCTDTPTSLQRPLVAPGAARHDAASGLPTVIISQV